MQIGTFTDKRMKMLYAEEYASCVEDAGCSRKSLKKQLSATVKVKGKR